MGELGTFYRLANFTFLGGSLLPIGGHNPFEPINLGCAVISGENFFNFKEVYDILQKASAFVLASSADDITKVVKDFLIDHQKAEASAQNGIRAINNSGNIAEKILNKSLEF